VRPKTKSGRPSYSPTTSQKAFLITRPSPTSPDSSTPLPHHSAPSLSPTTQASHRHHTIIQSSSHLAALSLCHLFVQATVAHPFRMRPQFTCNPNLKPRRSPSQSICVTLAWPKVWPYAKPSNQDAHPPTPPLQKPPPTLRQ